MAALWAGFHLLGPGFLFRCCVCLAASAAPARWHLCCAGHWGDTDTPGEAVREGLRVSQSSTGPGRIKLSRTWPAGTSWVSSKSLSLGGSLARAVGVCAVRFGDSSVPSATEPSRALTQPLSVYTVSSALTPSLTPIPSHTAPVGKWECCATQNLPGRCPEMMPPTSPGKLRWHNNTEFGNGTQHRHVGSAAALWKIHGWNPLEISFSYKSKVNHRLNPHSLPVPSPSTATSHSPTQAVFSQAQPIFQLF